MRAAATGPCCGISCWSGTRRWFEGESAWGLPVALCRYPGQGIQSQFRHGKVLRVLGDECAAIRDTHRGDAGVLERELLSPLRVVRFQAPSMLGDILSNGKEDEALHECPCGLFLVRPHAGIDLRQCDGARSERISLIEKLLDQKMAIVAPAKGIHDDVGVQDKRCHLLRNCFLKRASDSRRSSPTHAAVPALSSGWSLSFQLPTALRSASFWRAINSAFRTASAMKRLRLRFSTRRSRSARTSSGRVMWVRDVIGEIGYFDYALSVRRRGHLSRSLAGERDGHWVCVCHPHIRDILCPA